MNVVDLFSGGGGASTGFHQADFETIYAVDTAWHAVKTFKANHGDIVHQKDISKLRSEEIMNQISEPPDIVTASPPCEPFTSANHKRVKDPFHRLFTDKTGRLMLHAARLIADLDPEYYFIENVKGILDGNLGDLITEEFIDLGLGEPVFNWIQATNWGVPSRRTRVIISNVSLSPQDPAYRTTRDVIGDMPNPSYPHGLKYHYHIRVSEDDKNEMLTLPPGAGLVHFYGSNKDYQNYTRIRYDRPAPVVMGKSRFVHPIHDRLLTPLEHARLMTFPDNYQYIGSLANIFDLIGEAIPPNITNQIGKQLL